MTGTTTAVSPAPGGAGELRTAPELRRRVRSARAADPAANPRSVDVGTATTWPEGSGARTDAYRAGGGDHAGPRILVVDAEPQTGAAIAAMLGSRGGTVVRTVVRPQDALRWAAELRPDLVMLDVGLRGAAGTTDQEADGLGTAVELHRRRTAPVVLMIDDREPSRERIVASGALGCIRKPLRPAAVLPAVEVALARSATLAALRDQVEDITTRLRHRELIERAKALLITHRGMSEPQAFRWLQRTAMDRRTPMAVVAAATVDRLTDAAADPVGGTAPTPVGCPVRPSGPGLPGQRLRVGSPAPERIS